jgi:hypothetical protein
MARDESQVTTAQAEQLRAQLDRDYHAFVRIDRKPWINADDRAELRQNLEHSLKRAQAAMQRIAAQPGGSGDLQALRRKLVVLTTMAEGDLKQGLR